MSQTLMEIAQNLKEADKKVQLIYAFNGSGKTRLSREFKELIDPNTDTEETEGSTKKILYYNAFTEDLFYWDNDLEADAEPKMKIQPNSFTDWILKIQGDQAIIENFQRYTDEKLMPHFTGVDIVQEGKKTGEKTYTDVIFSYTRGDDTNSSNVKISKGEESLFIWSIFYVLIDQVISMLNIPEPADREDNQFDQLEYVFIDDPVSSLDDNHLIELAVNLAGLIKSSKSDLKFIITTHSPLFYNVLHSQLELNKKNAKEGCYLLERFDSGTFNLKTKYGSSNKSFSYHLYLKQMLEQAIEENQVQKHHFMLLRNLYEKTAGFLGYNEWADLLDTVEGDKKAYLKLIMNFSSHSRLSNEEVAAPTEQQKKTVEFLLKNLIQQYGFHQPTEDMKNTTHHANDVFSKSIETKEPHHATTH